jgi:hypothetical protein
VLVCRFEWRRLLKIMMVRFVYSLQDYIQLKNRLYCLIQSINFQYYHSLHQKKYENMKYRNFLIFNFYKNESKRRW